MHSTHSLDGNNSIAELCEQAVTLGLTHIDHPLGGVGLLEHCTVPANRGDG